MKTFQLLAVLVFFAVISTTSFAGFKTGDGNAGGNGFRTDAWERIQRTDRDTANYDPTVDKKAPALNEAKSNTPSQIIEKKPIETTKETATKSTQKVQKIVSKGGVVSYSDASSQQLVQNDPTAQIEIIKIAKSGFGSGQTSLPSTSTCKAENIGVNTASLNYYAAEMPLKDLAKMSMGWIRPWSSKLKDVKLDLDSNGYLKTVDKGGAQTIISDDNWGRAIDDNKYVVLYDGEGELSFNLNGTKIIKKEPGRIEIELGKGRTGMLELSTNPANYLRNIRIVPLANEFDYDEVITRKKYRNVWQGAGVIRYLNAQRTNNSKEVEWNNRQKQTTFGSKKGQSLEDIIQMSNETNTNPWILVPHLANDNYFREMAIYVRDHLNPHLKVYLEYSNETWNAQFTQFHYLQELSKESGEDHPNEYGKKVRKLFEIWTSVFGGNDRLVRVVASQKGNSWVSRQIMRTPGLPELTDALAITGYIGIPHQKSEAVLAMSDDEVFSYMTNEILPQSKKWLTEQKQTADKYNLKLIAYEGGQHLAPVGAWTENQELVDKFIRLNRHPKMYQLYMDIYKQWTDVGGELMVWFQTSFKPSKWGSWGLLENTGQDPQDSPKYQAYKQILKNNGC